MNPTSQIVIAAALCAASVAALAAAVAWAAERLRAAVQALTFAALALAEAVDELGYDPEDDPADPGAIDAVAEPVTTEAVAPALRLVA